jgi:hypothetical protein
MISSYSKTLVRVGLVAGAIFALSPTAGLAQDGVRQITQNVDETQRVILKGNTPPSAIAAYDQGRVNASEAANHMLLVLKRSASQEVDLQKLVDSLHDPKSPSYHQWLTPADFGAKFGTDDADVEVVKAWLQAKGFTINKTNAGKTVIDFSGTASQVEGAFHTELHRYVKGGVAFNSNSKDPEIPAAFEPVVKGLASLNNIKPKAMLLSKGRSSFDPQTHKGSADWNDPLCAPGGSADSICEMYYPTPADIATQYSLASLYKGNVIGKGVTIGIISESNIDVSNVQNYRSFFKVADPTNLPQTVLDGDDPGQNGAALEAYLDVEVSGALAPAAKINLYTGADTLTTTGLFTSLVRSIDDDQADVISLSYGECEEFLGSAGNQFFFYAWQQAAAQGQSVFVSSGDSGSAGCDSADTPNPASYGLAVSGFASTPYNVAVGGTDFYYSDYQGGYGSTMVNSQLAKYWGSEKTNSTAASLLTPIPEQAWNDTFGLNILKIAPGNISIAAGSGGVSSCEDGEGSNPFTGGYVSCTTGYPKPSWQTAPGVPNNGKRSLPDVSLFAADGANMSAWPLCAESEDCTDYTNASGSIYVTGVGGTSASSPAMAAIMALVDQSQGGRQGNPNVMLYALANQFPTTFNDVSLGNNKVLCYEGTTNCSLDKNGDGLYTTQKYAATAGYDPATGLGSVNGANLVANWSKVKFLSTTTALALSSTTAIHGKPITGYVAVFSSKGMPTGNAALVTNSATPMQGGQGLITLADGLGSAPFSLPGGTYDVYAYYSGDGQHSASDSSPISVTITPEPSAITLTASAAIPSQDEATGFAPTPIVNGSNFPYGYALSFDTSVTGKSGQGTATGTVSYRDLTVGINTIGVANVNSNGVAEFNTATLGAGPHVIAASYGGDPSFAATPKSGQPTSVSFTISKETPYISSQSESDDGSPVVSGEPFVVPFSIYSGSGAVPTGKVTVTYGSQVQQIAINPTLIGGAPVGTGMAVFKNPAAGTFSLTLQYPGDANYTSASSYPETVTVTAPTLLPSVTTLTSSTLNTGPDGTFTLTATVTGNVKVPLTGAVYFYINGGPIGLSSGAPIPVVNGKATVTLVNSNLFTGKNEVMAEYLDDTKYNVSSSVPFVITGNEGDFTVGTSNPNVVLTAGQTVNESLIVSSIGGLKGTVVLSCASSSPTVACSLNNPTVTLDQYGKQSTTSVMIYAAGGVAPQKQTVSITASDAGVVHTMSFNVTIQ